MGSTQALGGGLAGALVALALGACASAPAVPVPPPPVPVVRAVELAGADAPAELRGALAALAGSPLSDDVRHDAEAIAESYFEWLEWHAVEARAEPTLDAGGVLRVSLSGTPPGSAEPAPEEYVEMAMPFGEAVESAVPAPAGPSGARPETLDASFAFWLDSPARVLIDSAERRLYVKRPDAVVSYAVAVGTRRTPTPPGNYRVEGIRHKPTWYPPASIRREYARKGKPLPPVVPPGRGNPLGDWFVRLQNSIGIHGTNQPRSIGSAASHGCVRMHDADVGELVRLLKAGDEITIVQRRPQVAAGGAGVARAGLQR
ncbi:MAG TPA: L,D-transpeptidase [Solimonas sp.]|nr:L,D-transpeptidase [Solimonas sp.]